MLQHQQDPGSFTEIAVFRKFVSGSMDIFSDSSIGLNDDEEKGLLLADAKNAEPEDENRIFFDVGDLVWAKAQSQMWWPGEICDPSATTKASMSIKTEGSSLLVKYFGISNSVWCSTSDLKPFLRNFDEMSEQLNSRNFYGSVDKALYLTGQHIRANMTCPCFIKASENRASKLNVFSPSQFDPEAFLSCIRNMARLDRAYGKVEVTTTKNCLSAFYSSVGRCDLPLNLILGDRACDGKLNISGAPETRAEFKRKKCSYAAPEFVVDTAEERGSETRERKKSKYLSYPYIKLGSRSKNRKKNGGFEVDRVVGNNASASEMLAELHSAARDPIRSKFSDLFKRYYVSFREFSLLNFDAAQAPQVMKACENRKVENPVVNESENSEVAKDCPELVTEENETDMSESIRVSIDSVVSGSEINPDIVHNSPENGKVNVTSAKDCPELGTKENQTDMSESLRVSIDSVVAGLEINSNNAQNPPDVIPELNKIAQLPDLNGNITEIPVEKSPSKSASTDFGEVALKQSSKEFVHQGENTMNGISFGTITSLKDARLALQCSPPFASSNAGFGSSFEAKVPMALYASVVEPKYKPKLKEKGSEAGTGIPDLNGNRTTLSSDHEEKSKTASSNGGSLILTFSPGCTLPPKETLITTFSRFGLLKDSGFEVVDESTIRVPYERSSEARFAFRSLEKNKPFGPALASFELDCPAVVMRPVKKRMKNHATTQQPLVDTLRIRSEQPPDISFMKQSAEMMKSTLEKAGASLSAEIRTNLETEIKVFLDKIGSGTP